MLALGVSVLAAYREWRASHQFRNDRMRRTSITPEQLSLSAHVQLQLLLTRLSKLCVFDDQCFITRYIGLDVLLITR